MFKGRNQLNYNTALFNFESPKPFQFSMLPGKHILFRLTHKENGLIRKFTRPMTPFNFDESNLQLLIKSNQDGNFGKILNQLQVGNYVEMKGPYGDFSFHDFHYNNIFMISAGSGIAAIWQIILEKIKLKKRITLIYANNSERDILLKEELDFMASQNDSFRVIYVLDEPPVKQSFEFENGWIGTDILAKYNVFPSKNTGLLLCGPPSMELSVIRSLEQLGWKDNYFAFTTNVNINEYYIDETYEIK